MTLASEGALKKLFRIGEVSRLTGVNPHVLRYWEAEFQILSPNRRLSKQRLYRQADIDLILTIKHLLDHEKYTLPGVKQYLEENFTTTPNPVSPGPAAALPSPAEPPPEVIKTIREELQAIRKILDS